MDNFEDVILEDAAISQAEEPVEPVEVQAEGDTETPTEEPMQEELKLKIKYNHEEKEITLDEARELSQKGLNYEKAIEKAREESGQSAIDKYIANQGFVWNGQPIKTQAEYDRAMYENNLIEQGYDIEQINKGIEEHPEVKKAREQNQKSSEAQRLQLEVQEFNQEYEGVDIEKLDKEVYEYRNKTGKSITDSMRWFENKSLKEKVAKLEQNSKNAERTPVTGITAHGSKETVSDSDFIGFDD